MCFTVHMCRRMALPWFRLLVYTTKMRQTHFNFTADLEMQLVREKKKVSELIRQLRFAQIQNQLTQEQRLINKKRMVYNIVSLHFKGFEIIDVGRDYI